MGVVVGRDLPLFLLILLVNLFQVVILTNLEPRLRSVWTVPFVEKDGTPVTKK